MSVLTLVHSLPQPCFALIPRTGNPKHSIAFTYHAANMIMHETKGCPKAFVKPIQWRAALPGVQLFDGNQPQLLTATFPCIVNLINIRFRLGRIWVSSHTFLLFFHYSFIQPNKNFFYIYGSIGFHLSYTKPICIFSKFFCSWYQWQLLSDKYSKMT